MRNEITSLIFDAVQELNENLNVKLPLDLMEECKLFGGDGVLDSIALVTLIVNVEQRIEDKFNINIILANDKAMSQRNSPFLSIGTLTDFIEQLINEEQEV